MHRVTVLVIFKYGRANRKGRDSSMTSGSENRLPESQAVNIIAEENIVPSQHTKKKRSQILLGIGIGILACVIIGITAFIIAQVNIRKEIKPIESVLDSYMKYLATKDAKSAYALICPRAQKRTSLSELQNVLDGNIYANYHEKYQGLSVGSIEVRATTAGTDPYAPQGTVANVSGNISYEDGKQGGFNAILEKNNGKWQIFYVNISMPTTK